MPRAPHWRHWTLAEDDCLETLRLEGRTRAEIGTALGRTESAVRFRLGVLGVRRVWGLALRYLPLVTVPHTITGVARQLGVTRRAVALAKTKLRRAGFALWLRPGLYAHQRPRGE